MHGLYQTSQIAEGRRPGGISIPVRRAAEGGVRESKSCEPEERASVIFISEVC